MAWTFERVLRDCDHNERLKRDGLTRGLLYDLKVLNDGMHVAWWSPYSTNGQTDTRGFRYWLRDKMWQPIDGGNRHPVAARNREEFESVLIANLNRVPTDDELSQRKLSTERAEAAKKLEEDARRKRYQMESAAPDMLEALKELSAMYSHAWDAEGGALVMLPPSVARFEAAHEKAQIAIAKAEGVSK